MLRKHDSYVNVRLFFHLGKQDNEKKGKRRKTSKEAKICPDKFKNMLVAQAVSICFLASLRYRAETEKEAVLIYS